MKKPGFAFMMLLLAISFSCQKVVNPTAGETTITKLSTADHHYIPFETDEVLQAYKTDKEVIYYDHARKYALAEMIGTGTYDEMKWTGHHLSEKPVVINSFDGKPLFYDFIVYNAEENVVGTITTHARRVAPVVVSEFSRDIRDYSLHQSKSNENGKYFIDWTGARYVGLVNKSGTIGMLVSEKALEPVAVDLFALNPSVETIVDKISDQAYQMRLTDFSTYEHAPDSLLQNEDFAEELREAKNLTKDQIADSMHVNYLEEQTAANAYWKALEAENVILLTDDEIINESSKFLGRLIRRVFSGVDQTTRVLDEFYQNRYYRRAPNESHWCGPWVCGYILRTRQGIDRYAFFESAAASVGLFTGPLNFALRLLGRPMTPGEMTRALPEASNGQIWISPLPKFMDLTAYDQIKHYRKPAILLCGNNGELHYQLAYGTYQTGTYLWRNYYFLFNDNGAVNTRTWPWEPSHNFDPRDKSRYRRSVWWNLWFPVWG